MKMLWKLNYYCRFVQYWIWFNQFIWDDRQLHRRTSSRAELLSASALAPLKCPPSAISTVRPSPSPCLTSWISSTPSSWPTPCSFTTPLIGLSDSGPRRRRPPSVRLQIGLHSSQWGSCRPGLLSTLSIHTSSGESKAGPQCPGCPSPRHWPFRSLTRESAPLHPLTAAVGLLCPPQRLPPPNRTDRLPILPRLLDGGPHRRAPIPMPLPPNQLGAGRLVARAARGGPLSAGRRGLRNLPPVEAPPRPIPPEPPPGAPWRTDGPHCGYDNNNNIVRSQIEHVSDHPESVAKSFVWIKYFYFI